MDHATSIQTIKQALEPFVVYFAALFSSGYLTAAVTEATKLKAIFIPGEKYPRLTAGAVSVLTTAAAMYLTPDNLVFHTLWAYVPFALGVGVVSATVYKTIFKGLSTNTKTVSASSTSGTSTYNGIDKATPVTLPPNL